MPASKHQKSLTGLVLTACAALVLVGATACGSEESGGTGETPPKMEPLNAVGDGEGELNLIAWPGYAEDGSNDRRRRLGHAVREGDRMPDQREGRQYLRRDGSADAQRSVRRRLGVGRRHAAADLRAAMSPRSTPTLVPNYETISSFLKDKSWNSVDGQMYGIPHGWGANLLMYNIGVVTRRARLVVGGVRRRGQVQGQGHRVRLPHLHRRRGAVPVQDQAGAGHQRSVLADHRTTRRRSRIAQEAA